MKKHLILFFLLFVTLFVKSQEVISTQGDSYTDSSASIDYTIGEVLTSTLDNNGYLVTQGFHQISWSILSSNNILNEVDIKIFPNPTRDLLHVQLSNNEMPQMLSLYDLAGNKVLEVENADELNVTSIAAGVYTLSIQLQGSTFLKRVIIQ